jgi:hypothetical protein
MGAANTKRVRKPRKGARSEDGESAGEVRRAAADGGNNQQEQEAAQRRRVELINSAAEDVYGASRSSEIVSIYEERLIDLRRSRVITESQFKADRAKINQIYGETNQRRERAEKVMDDNLPDIVERSRVIGDSARNGRERGRLDATQPLFGIRNQETIKNIVRREIARQLAFSQNRRGMNVDVPPSIITSRSVRTG